MYFSFSFNCYHTRRRSLIVNRPVSQLIAHYVVSRTLSPIYSDTTQLDVELSCVAINGVLFSSLRKPVSPLFCGTPVKLINGTVHFHIHRIVGLAILLSGWPLIISAQSPEPHSRDIRHMSKML